MTPERYEQIAELYHAALDLPPERRAAFLDNACSADEVVRRDVESLLAANDAAGEFILSPAIAVHARRLAQEEHARVLTGRAGWYDIDSLVGRGGMGEVYKARDIRLGRHVALKLLHPALTGNVDAVRRFEQEARAASSLNHPNIVTVYEIGAIDSRRFLAMEFVDGQPLSARVGRPLELAEVARLGAQLARALAVAHAAGIVHRDIKPDNVIVRTDGYLKLVDFGLARLAPVSVLHAVEPGPDGVGTGARMLLGTPRYMSPEQARGDSITSASDVFSLGVVLCELATGTHPFDSPARDSAAADACAPAPAWLSQALPLKPLLLRMLHPLASGRPTAADVADELLALTEGNSRAARSGGSNRACAAHASQLPLPRTPLFGRTAEITALAHRLLDPGVRLLTITGAGGTGKTRLAVHVAATIAPGFEGGASFVDLAPISDASLVASTVARALGVTESRDRPLVASVAERLSERGPTLLVFDNFEQVIEAASIVRDLLDACVDVTVLITSRQALRIYGEQEFPLPPLPLPDAHAASAAAWLECPSIALFVQRAAAVRPDFSLTSANAATVADICRRLDGLPLAIELAAARITILPPADLLGRLERRLELLTSGARDLPVRQQTLRRTIAWSEELLTPAEKRLFRRLSVFVGGFTLEAAEAVCNAREDLGVDILKGLTSLVDNSLVVGPSGHRAEPRFSMLETFREYARERLLEDDDPDDVARAHAAYVLVLAEEEPIALNPPEREPWLQICDVEQDNIRAAFQYLIRTGQVDWAMRLGAALFRFWEQRELVSEGRDTLARVLALPGAEHRTPRRARVLYGASVLADVQGDLTAAEEYSHEACAIYRQVGDTRGMATAMSAMAWQAQHGGRHGEAIALHAQTVTLWQQLGEATAVDLARFSTASAARAHGDIDLARGILGELLTSCEARGDVRGVAAALNGLGDLASAQGDYPGARALYQRSLAAFRQIDDRWGIAQVLTDVAEIELQTANHAMATGVLLESLRMFQGLGHQRGVARQLERLAGCAASAGRDACAVTVASAAAAVRQRIGAPAKPAEQARIDETLATARARLGADAFGAAWREARLTSLEDVLEAVRRMPAESPTGTSADPSGV